MGSSVHFQEWICILVLFHVAAAKYGQYNKDRSDKFFHSSDFVINRGLQDMVYVIHIK